jgi:hypothetical protein
MRILNYTVQLAYTNSVDDIIKTSNTLLDVKCTIIDKKFTSITLAIEISDTLSLNDVLYLGTLIGSIEAKSLV